MKDNAKKISLGKAQKDVLNEIKEVISQQNGKMTGDNEFSWHTVHERTTNLYVSTLVIIDFKILFDFCHIGKHLQLFLIVSMFLLFLIPTTVFCVP